MKAWGGMMMWGDVVAPLILGSPFLCCTAACMRPNPAPLLRPSVQNSWCRTRKTHWEGRGFPQDKGTKVTWGTLCNFPLTIGCSLSPCGAPAAGRRIWTGGACFEFLQQTYSFALSTLLSFYRNMDSRKQFIRGSSSFAACVSGYS